MSIAQLQALIKKAQDEIDICNNIIIPLINKLIDSVSGVVFNLGNAANSLSDGIVINGVPQGLDVVEERKGVLENYINNLSSLSSAVSSYVRKLYNDISNWNAQIQRILAEQRRKEELEKKRK